MVRFIEVNCIGFSDAESEREPGMMHVNSARIVAITKHPHGTALMIDGLARSPVVRESIDEIKRLINV